MSDIISFGSPQAIFFNLLSILIILAVVPTERLVYAPHRCVFKNLILPLIFRGNCPTEGIFADCDCPACGMTRGMSRLLHGDLSGAWGYNKMVFVVLAVMISLIVYNLILSIRHYRKTGKVY